jgi:hypothetical protein
MEMESGHSFCYVIISINLVIRNQKLHRWSLDIHLALTLLWRGWTVVSSGDAESCRDEFPGRKA